MIIDVLNQVTLDQALVFVVPALIILGYALKQTPFVPDWLIVWVLLVVGTAAGVIAVGPTVDGVANGIIAAGMAVFSHQAFKQSVERE